MEQVNSCPFETLLGRRLGRLPMIFVLFALKVQSILAEEAEQVLRGLVGLRKHCDRRLL